MIHEFAVEPALVASWHDRQAYRFFDGKFGVGTKRALCRFPGKRWRRLVSDEFNTLLAGCTDKAKKQAAKKRLDALISHLEQGSTQRNRPWDTADTWLASALKEHARRPLHGIVVMATIPPSKPVVLVADELCSDNRRWNPPTPVVDRTSGAFLKALQPALRHGRSICFVDPYFCTDRGNWARPFREMIADAQKHRASDESIVFEVHCTVDHCFNRDRPWKSEEETEEAKQLISSICTEVKDTLGTPSALLIHVWSSKVNYSGKERLHNRYMLFETGGVNFGHGLDAPGFGTDDPTLLSHEQYAYRRRLYSPDSSEFRLVAKHSSEHDQQETSNPEARG